MNKLKVAIQALYDYLGADGQGRVLLQEITDIANVQRKRCASLEEASATSSATIESLSRKLRSKEAELSAMKDELGRESDRRSAAEARERLLAAKLSSLQGQDEQDDADLSEVDANGRVKAVRRMIRWARRHFKRLPGSAAEGYHIYVEDVIKDFSDDEFKSLGILVALCAFMGFKPRVKCDSPMKPGVGGWKLEYARDFIVWSKNHIHINKSEELIEIKCGLLESLSNSAMP